MMEAIRGRGTAGNPGNRFEPLHYEADPEVDPSEVPAPATRFYRDHSRSIIARNDSPDVGFSASINPYRGCEHGCVYCMCGDTPILMADGSTKRLDDVVVGDEIYGTAREGWYRRYVRTRVLAHWRTLKNAYRIMLADGTRLVSSGDHRFLTERGWKFVTGAEQGADRRPHLTCGNTLMGTGSFGEAPAANREYSAGYLCGMIRGDALLASYTYSRAGRTHGDQWQFRLALVDRDALLRTRQLLAESGIPTHEFVFSKGDGPRREIPGIRTHAAASVKRIQEIVELP